MAGTNLLEVAHVRRTFPRGGGEELLVLDDVNLSLKEGEIVGLLGRSGSGKSTLLRLIAGLARPQGGQLTYMGMPIEGPAQGVAMVFQSFALFPWLTVLENVELGLEALGLPPAETRARALAAIDLIGLDGYESAYPRELSGGMRQRVGFARAVVVHPNILLMDEPFSALDVLTAENLRTDLIELWGNRKLPIKGIILVTHNIEEAVLMCDRVLLMSSNPGRVSSEIAIKLPQPRDRTSIAFEDYVDQIYVEMTARRVERMRQVVGAGNIAMPLTHVSPNTIAGLVEALAAPPYDGKADLPDIAYEQELEVDELFPVAEAMQLLRLADVEGGDIKLTHMGKRFADSELNERKEIFARALIGQVPLAAHIKRVLDERTSHSAPKTRFLDELEDYMAEDAAEETLKTIVSWARFGELFSYDDDAAMFSLENPT
ncbi:MAG TPA: nitrate/sulfonate/bicarbonate ABC transporter ATP-binding protein [Rhizomicrobium sp.]|nr:nitrate/sulfonate/bicarbonate ABC transporter ATP-binding protein [Rhizomicrobium sp.]